MLYAQIPSHLLVKPQALVRNEPVERTKKPLTLDPCRLRRRNKSKEIRSLFELEAHIDDVIRAELLEAQIRPDW